MQFKSLIAFGIITAVTITGCSRTNSPTTPKLDSNESAFQSQLLKPAGTTYEAVLGGPAGAKPFFWFDADDTAAFNAEIRTTNNKKSSAITRVNGGTWGKVHTAAISCANNYNKIRIFPISKSTSSTWKLVIQEEGGAWRNWVLQDSTGQTGYMDYDFSTILNEINTGGGSFTINIIVEGAVGEYVEVGELYVYEELPAGSSAILWEEPFPWGGSAGIVPPGWSDQTNTPGLNARVFGVDASFAFCQLPDDNNITFGKVQTPTIQGDLREYRFLNIDLNAFGHRFNTDDPAIKVKMAVREIGGSERFMWLHDSWIFPPTNRNQYYAFNINKAYSAGFTENTKFRVEIWIEKTWEAQLNDDAEQGFTFNIIRISKNRVLNDIFIP